jgi:hypothetical protein
VFDRAYGATTTVLVNIFAGRTTAAFESPVAFEKAGYALLRFRGTVLAELPRRPCIAALVDRNASWAPHDSLEFAIDAQRSYRYTLNFPSPNNVVDTLLANAAREWQLSDKGRLGTAITTRHAAYVFLEPSVYEAIVALTTPRSKQLLAELQRRSSAKRQEWVELAATWGGRSQRRYRSAQQLRDDVGLEGVRAAELLTVAGWADRGFEVVCSACGVRSFVGLSDVDAGAQCPACGATATFTVDARGPVLMYRLDGLLDRASDQGVVPHLMARAALERSDDAYVLPGVSLVLHDGSNRELDLFGVTGKEVVAGEVKTSAVAFTGPQIKRDIGLSAAVGADVHVMASIKALTADALALAEAESSRRRLRLLVLSGPTLRPPGALPDA